MKTTNFASFVVALFSTLVSDVAFAKCLDLAATGDSTTPNSWCWPLHRPTRDAEGNLTLGAPRQLVFNGFGDFQDLARPYYLHPGIDIMAAHINEVTLPNGEVERLPDITVIPYDSDLVWVYDHDDCQGQSLSPDGGNMWCRMFFRTNDERFLYYFGHVRYDSNPQSGEAEPNIRVRTAVESLLDSDNGVSERLRCIRTGACRFARGEFGPMITEFPGFNHLHFTVVDRWNNYDNVTPWKYLAQSAIVDGTVWDTSDNRSPVINSVALVPNDVNSSVKTVIRSGECGDEVAGNVDVAAEAYDVFRDPDPSLPLPELYRSGTSNEMAVHSAVYYIERIVDASTRQTVQTGTWYEFGSGPMFCPGPDRGWDCPFARALTVHPPDDDQYFGIHNVWSLKPDEILYGAPLMGVERTGTEQNQVLVDGYAINLYRPRLSSVKNHDDKHETLVLTNEWGFEGSKVTYPWIDTSWDTTKMSDGNYRVSVMVTDYAGHTESQSITVRVRNGNRDDRDIWVADSDKDVGTEPSDADNQPYDLSPDVLVISADGDDGSEPKSTTTIDSLEALKSYHVWVRVRYGLCQSISGIKVALASADPADTDNQSNWKPIPGPDITFIGPSWATGGASLSPGQDADWIGPFEWTPSTSEGGGSDGRLLIVAVTSDDDSSVSTDMLDVPGHNNVAQRRLSITLPSVSCPTLSSVGVGFSVGGGVASNESVEQIVMTASTETSCTYVGTQIVVAGAGDPTVYGQAQLACGRQLNTNGNLECILYSANPAHSEPLPVACKPSTGSCCVIGSPNCSLS